MRERQQINIFGVLLLAAAAGISGCAYMESALQMPAAASAPAPAAPITREKASTDCWMKYEKSGLSLDQRLPLVEKCTAEKMKAQAAR